MPDFSVLDYGGLGLAALVIIAAMGFSFHYINKSADYLRKLTEWSIQMIADAGSASGDTNRRTAETLKRLADQFEKSQEEQRESFKVVCKTIEINNENSKEWRAEERREHEQLLLDHREAGKEFSDQSS
jgi:hypothetical protein